MKYNQSLRYLSTEVIEDFLNLLIIWKNITIMSANKHVLARS